MMNFLRILATESESAGLQGIVDTAYEKFKEVFGIVMPVLIGVIAMFGIVYGILLGIKFAKAEDTEARDKAKGQLINMVIGVLVALVIAVVMYAVVAAGALDSIFVQKDKL